MRRGLKVGQNRPAQQPSSMARELDWLLDEWRTSSPEARLQLVLAKIRQEDKLAGKAKQEAI